ncbi:hypothetical protein Tco_1379770, partial [Tanacetum coccineum]
MISYYQDKYVAEILKKFDFVSVKTASTPIETQKPLVKDEEASDVDVHLYRSMIGSLMYLTASRPDIMFAVCACSRFQVTPKTSHLSVIKIIFRYLKGKPKLGLWYPRVSSFDLEAYSDSDYVGANLDRKSTTEEAEYVVATNCCGQVLWIQNQMLDYGFNFMNTKIYIDNESTICIVKNPVYHSKTKHIAIRHHFIRDAYEKKLIQVLKIHTDDNVADLLTKAFDVSRESLRRVFDGTEALMLPTLFILWLATVSTDSAELVPMGKVSTAIETLKKNTAKALISLSPTITHSTIMVVLESCPKHNMVAYLEKTDGNAEFHEIIDFLTRSSIHHASHLQPTEDEGAISERPSEAQPNISPHPSASKLLTFNLQVGRKSAKGEPTVHKDPLFDEIPEDSLDYMETEDAQDEGRTRDVVEEDKENAEDVLSTAQQKVSTDKEKVSTDRPIVSTDGSKVSTNRQKDGTDDQIEGTDEQNEGTDDQIEGTDEQSEGTDDQIEGTDEQSKGTDDHTEEGSATQTNQPPTSTIFRDDKTIAQVLLNMSQAKAVSRDKEKGIDPKDKGKKKIEEEDESKSESDGIPKAE